MPRSSGRSSGGRSWRGRSLHPFVAGVAAAIVKQLREDGIRAVVTSGYRSLAKQRQLYARYRRGGPLAAPPGSSAHNYGLAVDIALVGQPRESRDYRRMHRIAERLGLVPLRGEAGRIDPYHVEVPNWQRLVTTPRRA